MGIYERWLPPRLLDLAMRNREAARYRLRIIPAARGEVLEIGAGSGLNLLFYATAALREARRVLKPGGALLFVEHGVAPDPMVERWQPRLNPYWKRVAGGCNLDRRIDGLVRAAGFEIRELGNEYLKGPRPFTCTYFGRAEPA